MTQITNNLFDRVYEIVKKIPKGEIMTYGQVARMIGTRDARRVGQALHANKDKNVPCHRVVFADGTLAPGYAFGGAEEQKKKLLAEGVELEGEKVKMGSRIG
ncbi:MAG: methylated-DNA-protein-cysteine methyltransferase related protein [Microgenomates group bacterium Gr01-1014_16]|nr:MAG: methylated-DNA-protein-cysteine methyltransferase related protein [Microgenomates group bacterium Gr01-1014_16]